MFKDLQRFFSALLKLLLGFQRIEKYQMTNSGTEYRSTEFKCNVNEIGMDNIDEVH